MPSSDRKILLSAKLDLITIISNENHKSNGYTEHQKKMGNLKFDHVNQIIINCQLMSVLFVSNQV
jgi:hypothetical protein